jgi:hypothetical protein
MPLVVSKIVEIEKTLHEALGHAGRIADAVDRIRQEPAGQGGPAGSPAPRPVLTLDTRLADVHLVANQLVGVLNLLAGRLDKAV